MPSYGYSFDATVAQSGHLINVRAQLKIYHADKILPQRREEKFLGFILW